MRIVKAPTSADLKIETVAVERSRRGRDEWQWKQWHLHKIAELSAGDRHRGGTVVAVDRVVPTFSSFEDADQADHQFYADLTPEERLDVLLELVERYRSGLGEAGSRFERVLRIVELSQD